MLYIPFMFDHYWRKNRNNNPHVLPRSILYGFMRFTTLKLRSIPLRLKYASSVALTWFWPHCSMQSALFEAFWFWNIKKICKTIKKYGLESTSIKWYVYRGGHLLNSSIERISGCMWHNKIHLVGGRSEVIFI